MLRKTNEIIVQTENVLKFLNNKPLLEYFQKEFIDYQDALLAFIFLLNNDNYFVLFILNKIINSKSNRKWW